MNDEGEKKGYKFADKRRFDDSGNEKGIPANGGSEGFVMKESGHDESDIDFSSFVMSLATQGMMQLGEVPAPQGVSVPQDPVLAKQTIDILSMLRVKTKGNLDEFEDQLFEEILHNVRMAYIRKTSK